MINAEYVAAADNRFAANTHNEYFGESLFSTEIMSIHNMGGTMADTHSIKQSGFPDEERHLADTLRLLDRALTKAQEDVARLDREYKETVFSWTFPPRYIH